MKTKHLATCTLLAMCVMLTGCNEKARQAAKERQAAQHAHEQHLRQMQLDNQRQIAAYDSQVKANALERAKIFESEQETTRHAKAMETLEDVTPLIAIAVVILMGLLTYYLWRRKQAETAVELHRTTMETLPQLSAPAQAAYLEAMANQTGQHLGRNQLGYDG